MTNATETTIKTVESFGHTFAVTREVIFKDLRNGWEGQTRIDMGLDGFGQPRMLMMTTGKPHRRQDKGIGATTTATLYKVDGAFISVAMFHDFYDTVHVGKPGKCTEREVRECHAGAMAVIEGIIGQVVGHYAGKGEMVGWDTKAAPAKAA